MRFLLCLISASVLVAQVLSRPPAVLLRKVEPEYSVAARAAGYQGTVSLYLEVDAEGRPTNVQVMQGLGVQAEPHARQRRAGCTRGPGSLPPGSPPAPWHVSSEVYWGRQDWDHPFEMAKPALTHYVAPDRSACPTAGNVVVGLTVGMDGTPHDVQAARGEVGSMADAAVKAVQSWRFRPAFGSGQAVEARAEVEFQCRPAGGPAESDSAPVYRVGGGVSAPVAEFIRQPEYSEEARKAKFQGSVMLFLQVSPAGGRLRFT